MAITMDSISVAGSGARLAVLGSKRARVCAIASMSKPVTRFSALIAASLWLSRRSVSLSKSGRISARCSSVWSPDGNMELPQGARVATSSALMAPSELLSMRAKVRDNRPPWFSAFTSSKDSLPSPLASKVRTKASNIARGSAPPNDEARGGGAMATGRWMAEVAGVAAAPVCVSICHVAVRLAVAAPAMEVTFIEDFLLKTPLETMLNGSMKP